MVVGIDILMNTVLLHIVVNVIVTLITCVAVEIWYFEIFKNFRLRVSHFLSKYCNIVSVVGTYLVLLN